MHGQAPRRVIRINTRKRRRRESSEGGGGAEGRESVPYTRHFGSFVSSSPPTPLLSFLRSCTDLPHPCSWRLLPFLRPQPPLSFGSCLFSPSPFLSPLLLSSTPFAFFLAWAPYSSPSPSFLSLSLLSLPLSPPFSLSPFFLPVHPAPLPHFPKGPVMARNRYSPAECPHHKL